MDNELLLALCEALGFKVQVLPVQDLPSGQILAPLQYKLTNNKPALVPIEIHSDEWSCIVNFVTSHSDDIEQGINDFGDLKPLWDFMNRNSNGS